MRRLFVLTTLALLAGPSAAHAAGPPIMPLSQVTQGMRCTAATVVRGTEISTFDVEILDVVTSDAPSSARILFRASGPAVDATGVAEGYSGSPITCPDADGVPRIVGAVSEGIGQYGGLVDLATPIEAVLALPVSPPKAARRDPALLRSARPLTTPLTLSGLSSPVADVVRKAAASVSLPLITSPARPRTAAIPPQPLQPGASIYAGYSSGDVASGAIGTVTYVDGTSLWAFGHPLDGAGPRALILGDAYVYTVVGNPLGLTGATSYKLASPENDLGTITNDGPNSIAGRIGTLPERIPLTTIARDADNGTAVTLRSQVADERSLALPNGSSALSMLAPVSALQASYEALAGNPPAQTGSMCLHVQLEGRAAPLGFCNRYVGAYGGANGLGSSPILADVGTAMAQLDAFRLTLPRIRSVRVSMTLRRGLHQAYMLSAQAPKTVRRGHDVRVRIRYQRVLDGGAGVRTVTVHVPRSLKPGRRLLALDGTPADVLPASAASNVATVLNLDLSGLGDDEPTDSPGDLTVDQLAAEIAADHRDHGVTAQLRTGESAKHATAPQRVLNDPNLRFSGSVTVPVRVR